MGDWRRSSSNWEQQRSNWQPKHGRPPHHPGTHPVPSWEKKFCYSVGIPWRRVCETQDMKSMYTNVVEWDDSAALEAFHDAKARFWAKINGQSCDIPLPDPDMYIDEVDYFSVIDPELVADLEKMPPAPAEENNDANRGLDPSILSSKPVGIIPTGWGDAEDPIAAEDNTIEHQLTNWDDYIDKPIVATGWGDAEDSAHTDNKPSSWGMNIDTDNVFNYGGRDVNCNSGTTWNCSAGWGYGDVQGNSWGHGGYNSWDNGRSSSRGTWQARNNEPQRNARKRDGAGQFSWRSTKPRYEAETNETNTVWSNNRGRNGRNYSYEKAYAKQPLAMR